MDHIWKLCFVIIVYMAMDVQGQVSSSSNSDEFYILLDRMSVFDCNGVTNQIEFNRKDIKITDEFGNQAHYVKAPGEYYIEFSNLKVPDGIQNLGGEIGASLQVPVFQGVGGLRFDVPYQVVPEQKLLSAKCDDQSGVIEHKSQKQQKHFCRYCNLCATAKDASGTFGDDSRKFLPDMEGEDTDAILAPVCDPVKSDKYSFKRRLNLPGKSELEAAAKKYGKGVSDEITQRLEKGAGRFNVFANLLSSEAPANDPGRFFATNGPCVCYSAQHSRNWQCQLKQSLPIFRSAEQCKSDYVAQCFGGQQKTVACATVEFNYKLAFEYSEVQAFLKNKGLPETQGRPRPTRPTPSAVNQEDKETACVASIKANGFRRYCSLFWTESACCNHCPGVC